MSGSLTPETTLRVLLEVSNERRRQDAKWGEQNHPDGTGPETRPFARTDVNLDLRTGGELALIFTDRTNRLACEGTLTFEAILTEEYAEALAEDDPASLRAELVQVAAVAVAWVEKIDRDLARRLAGAQGARDPEHQAAHDRRECCGADDCEVGIHVHGCYSDTTGSCDDTPAHHADVEPTPAAVSR